MKLYRLLALAVALALVITVISGCTDTGPGGPTPAPSPSANYPVTTPSPATTPSPIAMPAGIQLADGTPDSYVVVAPRILRSGQTERVSVSLFSRDKPARGTVRLVLADKGKALVEATGEIRGRDEIELAVPKVSDGSYELQVSGNGFQASSPIKVEDGTLVFVETDKPIYKPGQTIHVRVLALDQQLIPLDAPATVEVADAKGTKVFKKEIRTGEWGMATIDMPLSTEPNLGVWKLTVTSGKRTAQLDVRVERYVLPKYEVKVELARDWVLAGDRIKGKVSAEYSYGKPVQGEVTIKASRYVGTWQEFASVSKPVDGSLDFDLPPVNYASGVPGARGMGNINLEVTVREQATGYEEKATRLISVASSPVILRLIPESVSFKPSLPLSVLVVAETPDKKPVDAEVQITTTYTKKDFRTTKETNKVSVKQGKAIAKIAPPVDAISLTIDASSGAARSASVLQSGYSPSGSFILVEPAESGTSAYKVGDTARFKVSASREASNFYYEVLARGKVVFSSFSRSPEIAFQVSPLMSPESRLLVYQVLPSAEVAADYIPFLVAGSYPQRVDVKFSQEEVKPGDSVEVAIQTAGEARVGLSAVDRSVFILAENRLNLQQVFAELERLYRKPQAELHEAGSIDKITIRGAKDVFTDAGTIVLSNKSVPQGQELSNPVRVMPKNAPPFALGAVPVPAAVATAAPAEASRTDNLAEVQRVRQFFPETWIWADLSTDRLGVATKQFQAPDSITTWMLRAVAVSKQHGLGISEAQLRVMQPFFVQVDLPYAAIRGEQFPVKVALYNYEATTQEYLVQIDASDWFNLQDQPSRSVKVGPNSVGSASFTIRPTKLGNKQVKVTARSTASADSIIKEVLIEPEGVSREVVENHILTAGNPYRVDTSIPNGSIEGSARAYLAITGNYLTQTIQGLEKLLQMPFGCGEQNMVLFAPNVFVSKYLKQTNQLKPEVMAKAELMMVTGYQRELIYRRQDGSFSAFGNQDKVGSLWLTAFVMKTFAQAKELVYIDDAVQSASKGWITNQQKPDGSFEPVGFVHHQEMMGGAQGKTPLTAYVAISLLEMGDQQASAKAIRYLEGALEGITDTYTLAITTYALEMAKSPRAETAYRMLMAKAQRQDSGLFWDREPVQPMPPATVVPAPLRPGLPPRPSPSVAIETTAYATMALLEHGDRLNAAQSARWLVGKRNSSGGFGSTQDTVVGLQALTRYATDARSDVNATLLLRAGSWQKEVRVTPENADVLQMVELPLDGPVTVESTGKGDVVLQSVRRYNLPDPEQKQQSVFQIDVAYGTGNIQVDDLIDVTATVRFTPPEPVQAGMVVLDVAVPTGFTAEAATVTDAVKNNPKIKRYDVAGRKVIFYIEDMAPGDQVQIAFKARALYPVRAQAVASQAYAYYRTEWKGESLGGATTVSAAGR